MKSRHKGKPRLVAARRGPPAAGRSVASADLLNWMRGAKAPAPGRKRRGLEACRAAAGMECGPTDLEKDDHENEYGPRLRGVKPSAGGSRKDRVELSREKHAFSVACEILPLKGSGRLLSWGRAAVSPLYGGTGAPSPPKWAILPELGHLTHLREVVFLLSYSAASGRLGRGRLSSSPRTRAAIIAQQSSKPAPGRRSDASR